MVISALEVDQGRTKVLFSVTRVVGSSLARTWKWIGLAPGGPASAAPPP